MRLASQVKLIYRTRFEAVSMTLRSKVSCLATETGRGQKDGSGCMDHRNVSSPKIFFYIF